MSRAEPETRLETLTSPVHGVAMNSMPIMYALGSNGSGQLSIGHTDDVDTPQQCMFLAHNDNLANVTDLGKVTKIVAGGNHTLVLTDTGRLFVAGKSHLPLRGGEGEGTSSTKFQEITNLVVSAETGEGGKQITHIAATWEASFVVVGRRRVSCWGMGMKGELGLGPSCLEHLLNVDDPPKTAFDIDDLTIEADTGIIAIEASMGHVVVLLSNGHIYGWGNCRKGQLGEQFIAQKVLWSPTELDLGVDGQSLLAFSPQRLILGREYTVFFREGETPVLWGIAPVADHDEPLVVFGVDDVAVSGWSSMHVLRGSSSLARVDSRGKNNHGQLAPNELPPVRALAAGSEHCVAITNDDQVIAWGWGEHGNCGKEIDHKGNVLGRWNVIHVPNEHTFVRDVSAGCATTFLICDGVRD